MSSGRLWHRAKPSSIPLGSWMVRMIASSATSGDVFNRSDSRRLSQRQKPLRSQYRIFTRLRAFNEKDEHHRVEYATFISSSNNAVRPSVDLRKPTGLGYRCIFFDFCIVSHHDEKGAVESAAQHLTLAKRFECGACGALTLENDVIINSVLQRPSLEHDRSLLPAGNVFGMTMFLISWQLSLC